MNKFVILAGAAALCLPLLAPAATYVDVHADVRLDGPGVYYQEPVRYYHAPPHYPRAVVVYESRPRWREPVVYYGDHWCPPPRADHRHGRPHRHGNHCWQGRHGDWHCR